jgi:hypothetical protein
MEFSTACDSALITSTVKMAAFQIYHQSGKQRKIAGDQARRMGWVGGNSLLFLVKNLLVKKEV